MCPGISASAISFSITARRCVHGPFELAGDPPQPAQHPDAFHISRKHQPASRALGMEFEGGVEVAHRAVDEVASLGGPPVFLPLAETFLPFQFQRANRGSGVAANTALGVWALLDSIDGRAGRIIGARGIGNEGPDRLRRLGEMPLLAVVKNAFLHRQSFQRRRPLPAMEDTPDRPVGFGRLSMRQCSESNPGVDQPLESKPVTTSPAEVYAPVSAPCGLSGKTPQRPRLATPGLNRASCPYAASKR